MEASKITIGEKTFDLNHLSRSKKTNLRRKKVIEYIQSKPAGELIGMNEFKDICRFDTYANTWAFIKRMTRDGVIQQHEGEKKKSYYYSVIGAVRISTPRKALEQLPSPNGKNPDINAFVADMQRLGVEFSITISNKKLEK